MISSGYQSKSLDQAMPEQLATKLKSHDLIVSRTRRTIRPNGAGDALGKGAVLDFNINSSSEWLDVETAIFHAKLTIDKVSDGTNPVLNPYPKSNWSSLIHGYTLQCKGQALETSTDSGNLQSWNALRSRLYHDPEQLRTSAQLKNGSYDSITGKGPTSFVFQNTRNTGETEMVAHIAIPLKNIVNFFNLDRSYIPIMMIPLLLRMTLNSVSNAFVSPANEALPTNYQLDNVYIAGDFLQMDASVDEMMRKLVMEQSVSFFYPSVFITNESQSGDNINLKTNLNSSNLDAVFCFLTQTTSLNSDLYPAVTEKVWDAKTMEGAKYQLYIDSRNVFSEPITNAAEAFHELEKACKNDNDRFLLGAPVISSFGYLEGIDDGDISGNSAKYADFRCQVLAVNLSRQITPHSVSGVNVSLTGGRLMMEIQGLPNTNRECVMFYKHTRELVVSRDFLQVIT
jgi:hypothetical protein